MYIVLNVQLLINFEIKQVGRIQHKPQQLREICIKLNDSFLEIGGFLLPYPGKVVATSPLYSGQVKGKIDR